MTDTLTSRATQSINPNRITRRIGNTTYSVCVSFSSTSKESMSDKIIRLIKNEADNSKALSFRGSDNE